MKRSTLALPSALEPEQAEVWLVSLRRGAALFLDYDGTLTPIVARPELAILSDSMRQTVRQLASRFSVTIVSGRDVAVVASLVGVEGLGYVGSHGLDITGPPGSDLRKEVALDFLGELDLVEAELRRETRSIDGVVIERKRFSISTHVRLAARGDLPRVEAVVDEVGGLHPSLRREGGKMLLELRPDIDWDKGAAVLWLLDAMGLDPSAALFIGDDLTDETVFRVLAERGTGIVVADSDRPTDACLRLRDPDEVHTLLDRLVRTPAESVDAGS